MGELAALSGAATWTIAAFLFSDARKHFSAISVNLLKGVIAIPLLGIGAILLHADALPTFNQTTLLLCLSGVLGIAIGDTAFFAALSRIGPRKTLLIESTTPILTGILAMSISQEFLSPVAWLGVCATTGGIIWVMLERTPSGSSYERDANDLRAGIAFATLAALSQAAGSALSHKALYEQPDSALWAAFIRLTAAVGCITLFILPKMLSTARPKIKVSGRVWRKLLLATFLGTFIGLWLQQLALQYASAAVAQSLLSLSPLFALGIAVHRGETLSPRTWMGTIIALVGIMLLIAPSP